MAIVSKQEIRVLDEKFIKIVKYSANTETFTIELPESVHKKIGKVAEGGTLKEVNAKFSYMIQAYKEANTSKVKVLLVKLEATIEGKSDSEDKYYELEDIDFSHAGAAVSLACGVFEKYITKIPNNMDRIDYEYVEVDFPQGFHKIQNEWIREKDYIELPWSEEYEVMFKDLATAMKLLIFKLLAIVGTKKTIDKFMISGQKLLDTKE